MKVIFIIKKIIVNTNKLPEISTIRELTPIEVQNVAGGWRIYGGYDSTKGLYIGGYLGKRPGRG